MFMKKIWGKSYLEAHPHNNKGGLWGSIKRFTYNTVLGIRRTAILVSIVSLIFTVGYFANKTNDAVIHTVEKEVIREVQATGVPPVLTRIASCELWGVPDKKPSHSDPKTGQVFIGKSGDVGKYHINAPIWGKKATELGLDLTVEAGNEAMAVWIYHNHGTEPWYLTKSCWR